MNNNKAATQSTRPSYTGIKPRELPASQVQPWTPPNWDDNSVTGWKKHVKPKVYSTVYNMIIAKLQEQKMKQVAEREAAPFKHTKNTSSSRVVQGTPIKPISK